MRTITVSEPVWQAIASRGKFGEAEDDVLRRVFNLPANPDSSDAAPVLAPERRRPRSAVSPPRRPFATDPMSSYLSNGQLHVSFQSGASRSWPLPEKSDKATLRAIREKAVAFARENGATPGQVNALKKTLTDGDYHLTR